MVCMYEKLDGMIMFNFNAPEGAEYMPNSGALQESISMRKLDENEAQMALIERHDIILISDDIWESKSREQGKGELTG